MASAISPLTKQGAGQMNKDQTIGYISVTLNVSTGSLSQGQVQSIIDEANEPLEAAGLHPPRAAR